MSAISKTALIVSVVLWSGSVLAEPGQPLTDVEQLGKLMFNDTTLSQPHGQSCASCHEPSAGFADPDQDLPVSEGVIPGRFGNRNTPTAAYATFSPDFHYDAIEQQYIGGQFHDGRSVDLAHQARQPFLNPLEMNMPDPAAVVARVREGAYADKFRQVYGPDALDEANVDQAYVQMSEAIAAFESSTEVNPFTSKFDYFLKGEAQLTKFERDGMAAFKSKSKGNCASCHTITKPDNAPGPLFTDFTYSNIGIPKNQDNPFLDLPPDQNPDGRDFVDLGLGVTVAEIDPDNAAAENGKFKVSTLRNVELTGPYGHNGLFETLEEIVEFYNTRDVPAAGWAPPEVLENMDTELMGDLGLSDYEEKAIVAFMLTLTDGYVVPEPFSVAVMMVGAAALVLPSRRRLGR